MQTLIQFFPALIAWAYVTLWLTLTVSQKKGK
jgi:hypothetical protein